MIIIDSPSNDAYFNIASEEYLLSKYPNDEIFLLYINAPSIIIGRYQNTLAEINKEYVDEQNIKVVRRLSGGGAVYHDLGNLNFSFHSKDAGGDFSDFSTFTKPVVKLLNELDVPAKFEGRNDLLVDGKKFSGNAKLSKNGKIIQHGTILINSEMKVLSDALKINPLKYKDKAVKSNRARVCNLIEYLPESCGVAEFKALLIQHIMDENGKDSYVHELTEDEIDGIQELANKKYNTWDWNFGSSPKYSFNKAIKVKAGFIELHMDVRKGMIQSVKIFGDFFASKPIEEFEALFSNVKNEGAEIENVLKQTKLSDYFGKVEVGELQDLFK